MATSTENTAPAASQPTTPPIDIIYHNMHAGSDFITFRASSNHSLKSNIATVAKHVADDCYTVISMNVSTYSVVVVFSTPLSKAELREKGFPFPIPEGGEPTGVGN
ncbi:hypothetical protein ONS95_006332 [Cadophora gregata]|uniref:uncharacterized protein n=1 Tax=Cadophora gregata TaxID=51156 RepID=UPI0026DCB2E9|nr:uncharacterized protein ONS95_006332 [Cadophora gregata]KAK0099306.1 hypothetical protein ONS96_008536 [Cadophora gregata f. sp. sojae]KAK0102732.1 hypothetical protein ONS95_006332 [Cadophora gregata]